MVAFTTTTMYSFLSYTYPEVVPPSRNSLGSDKLISDSNYTIVALVFLGCGMVVAICGIFTNVINIKTFIAMGVEDGVTTLFLAMSCTDLAFVMLVTVRNTMATIVTLEKEQGAWLLTFGPQIMSYFSDNSAFVMYTLTILTSTFLAVARCMCVAMPLQFKHTFTRTRCLVALVPLYLFPIACQTAVFVNMGTVEKFDKGKNASRLSLWFSSDRERVKDIVRLMLSSILPLGTQIILIVCVAVMVFKLKESARFRTGQNTDNTEKTAGSTKLVGKDRQVVKQVVLISLIFIVFNIHKIIHSFISALDPRIDHGRQYENMFKAMHHLRIVFETLNATVNIFVYYFYNAKYRSLCFKCG